MAEHKPIIALIGAGMMGEAIIIGLIRQDITDPANIRVFDPKDDRINELIDRYQITGSADNLNNIQNADIIILAFGVQKTSINPACILPGLLSILRHAVKALHDPLLQGLLR